MNWVGWRVEALTLTLSQRERGEKVIDGSGAFAPRAFQASGWGRPRVGQGVRPAKAGRTISNFRIIAASLGSVRLWVNGR